MARKAGLTCADVVETAADIADRDGLDTLTLARVAAHLGIRPPSLYAHVDGLAGLRRLLALRAAALLQAVLTDAVDGEPGAGALQAAAHALRRFIHTHPGLYAATLPAPSPDQDDELYRALAAASSPVIDAAAAAGLEGVAAVDATRAVRAAVHGFATLERANGFAQPYDIDHSFDVMIAALVTGAAATATAAGGPTD